MIGVFIVSDKPREQELAKAFKVGARLHGVKIHIIPKTAEVLPVCDFACMVGVKSKVWWERCKALGIMPVMFDKGYTRQKGGDSGFLYWRIAVGAHQPTFTTLHSRRFPSDRFEALRLDVKPWKVAGENVLFAGSSEKYHAFKELPPPTVFATKVIDHLTSITQRPIVYRPKPSWKGVVPIPGSELSFNKLEYDLQKAHCIVTHGSNICFEAMLSGVPSIILGDAVAYYISSSTLSVLENPIKGRREPILSALAYHQWTLTEMRSGECFNTFQEWIR